MSVSKVVAFGLRLKQLRFSRRAKNRIAEARNQQESVQTEVILLRDIIVISEKEVTDTNNLLRGSFSNYAGGVD